MAILLLICLTGIWYLRKWAAVAVLSIILINFTAATITLWPLGLGLFAVAMGLISLTVFAVLIRQRWAVFR